MLVAGMFPAAPALAQQFPPLTGRVVDAANVIPADVEARLDGKLAALETQSRRQLVVATIPDLQDYDIADYGYRLGRAWGIGDKQRNDGVLLIVAPNQRKLRIEVGYGMEPIITDGLSSVIVNQTIVPRFKAGDIAGGIEAGTDALIAQMSLPEDQARAIAQQASRAPVAPEAQIPLGAIVFLFIFLFFFVLPLLRSVRGARRYSRGGMPPVIVWPGGFSGGSSGGFGGGGFGGGGFSGGGFSGGGGSFGGGGSSGSW